nr:hypothetical protein [Tanacetum cinerariifolium]
MVIRTTRRTLCGAGWRWWCGGDVMMEVGMTAAVGGVVVVTRGGGDVTAVVIAVVAWRWDEGDGGDRVKMVSGWWRLKRRWWLAWVMMTAIEVCSGWNGDDGVVCVGWWPDLFSKSSRSPVTAPEYMRGGECVYIGG